MQRRGLFASCATNWTHAIYPCRAAVQPNAGSDCTGALLWVLPASEQARRLYAQPGQHTAYAGMHQCMMNVSSMRQQHSQPQHLLNGPAESILQAAPYTCTVFCCSAPNMHMPAVTTQPAAYVCAACSCLLSCNLLSCNLLSCNMPDCQSPAPTCSCRPSTSACLYLASAASFCTLMAAFSCEHNQRNICSSSRSSNCCACFVL